LLILSTMAAKKKSIRAEYIAKRLKQLYPNKPIPPLDHTNPFTLLVAVLLSAQCRDERVNKVTPELFALADNPEKMMTLSVDQIQNIIRPCGLSLKKAQSIKGLSEILVEKYGGRVPANLEELEELPGVGHKTAQVVLIQAFNKPAFPVDTHIHRLAKRWKLSDGRNVMQTEKDLKQLFPEADWGELHLRIIFYAREYCTAWSCDGKKCVICKELIKLK
jgi:endonuclease-3